MTSLFAAFLVLAQLGTATPPVSPPAPTHAHAALAPHKKPKKRRRVHTAQGPRLPLPSLPGASTSPPSPTPGPPPLTPPAPRPVPAPPLPAPGPPPSRVPASPLTPPVPSTSPHLHAVRTPTPPALDGKIDDPVWTLAPPASSFTQKIPADGAAPSDPTTVRVLYDNDAVYVAFDCPQPHTPVVERLTRRDRIVESDAVTFDLGTRGDHKSAFEFYVNASGTLADAIRFNDTDYSADWDENWEARTQVGAHGWTAEFRIPLRVLRFPSAAVQSWDFQASRYISERQETDVWAYFPRSVAGEVSHYGRLDDLDRLEAHAPIELRPFLVGRVRRQDAGSVGQLASGWDWTASAGLDLKWHVTPSLTLDATVNPDFAQVEADQVVLNLSTVETYYPEKRPFFLEGIDALTTPFQLLYTRRIGRVPPIPALRTDPINDEQLVDVPENSTIYGAAKLTGHLTDKWSVATVQAVTAQNNVQVQLGNGTVVSRLVDPTSSFGVARITRDVGDNAHIGVMGTAVTHAEPTEQYPLVAPGPGYPRTTELCPNPVELTPLIQTNLQLAPRARCFNDAYAGAIDWRWRSPSGDYATGGQVVTSVLENGPVRAVADGTQIHPGDAGWGAQAYLNKEGGKHLVGDIRAVAESRKLDINDAGYNDRANVLGGHALVELRQLDPWGPFREVHLYGAFATTYDTNELLQSQNAFLTTYGRFKNRWDFAIDAHYSGTRFDDREVGDGTALERARRFGNETVLATDATKRVSLSFDQVTESIADGFNTSGSGALSIRMLPQFDLDLLPTWQWTYGEPRFVSDGPTSGQYLFGKLEAKSVGLTLRTTYTFAPRITLQAYAQLFLASGHYSAFTQYQSQPTAPRPVVHLADLTPYSAAIPTNPDFEQGVL
ncbi:MAG: DUF5916 domain-containing protein, partial [Polyangiaceae bacterium]